MQISIKGYIMPKESELFYDCADRYKHSTSQDKFAISDGVSKSFFPKIWANILVNKWVSKEWNTNKEFIEHCQEDWIDQVTEIVNKPDIKWFTKNAFNRKEPGLATFVGLEFYQEKNNQWHWKAFALGDSFLFFVPQKFNNFSKECILLSSKPEKNIVFDNFPDYITSIGENHKGYPNLGRKNGILKEGTFYLMTDALAEWFLNEKDNAISEINDWQNQKDFERFVVKERHNEKLGNDDSAILKITLEEDKKDKLTYVLEKVSDIDELIKVQQKEIEVSAKAEEEGLTLKKANSNSEISAEDIKQEELAENEPAVEVKTEIEKPKKTIFEWINKISLCSEKEKEQSAEGVEIETDNKVEALEEHQQKEEELETQVEKNNSEIDETLSTEKNEVQENETNSKEKPESKAKKTSNPSQNITDKF